MQGTDMREGSASGIGKGSQVAGRSIGSEEVSLTREQKLEIWRTSKGKGAGNAALQPHARLLKPLSVSQVNSRQSPMSSSCSQPRGKLSSASAPETEAPALYLSFGHGMTSDHSEPNESGMLFFGASACLRSGSSDFRSSCDSESVSFRKSFPAHEIESDEAEGDPESTAFGEALCPASQIAEDSVCQPVVKFAELLSSENIIQVTSGSQVLDSVAQGRPERLLQTHNGAYPALLVTDDAWSEEELEDEVSKEDLQVQLFDTSNRLAQCTAVLQRMVEENCQLREQVDQLAILKGKCAMLESAVVEMRVVQSAAQAAEDHFGKDLPGAAILHGVPDCESADSHDYKRPRVDRKGGRGQECREDHEELSCGSVAEEVSRLRLALAAQQKEYSEERQRHMEKLMKSEERARTAQAAVTDVNQKWQQLFDSQMITLREQLKVALHQKQQKGNDADST